MTPAEPGPEFPTDSPTGAPAEEAPSPPTKPPLLRRPMFLYWVVVIALVIVMLTIGALNRHTKSRTGSTTATAHNGVSTRPSRDTAGATTSAPTTTTTTSAPTTTTTAPPPTTTSTLATPPVPTTPASTPQTLQSQNGAGVQLLSPFTVPPSDRGWLIHYLFNCASLGSTGNLRINVEDPTGSTLGTAANLVGVNGGSTYYDDAPGTYRLHIDTACDWAVVVQTIPR